MSQPQNEVREPSDLATCPQCGARRESHGNGLDYFYCGSANDAANGAVLMTGAKCLLSTARIATLESQLAAVTRGRQLWKDDRDHEHELRMAALKENAELREKLAAVQKLADIWHDNATIAEAAGNPIRAATMRQCQEAIEAALAASEPETTE